MDPCEVQRLLELWIEMCICHREEEALFRSERVEAQRGGVTAIVNVLFGRIQKYITFPVAASI